MQVSQRMEGGLEKRADDLGQHYPLGYSPGLSKRPFSQSPIRNSEDPSLHPQSLGVSLFHPWGLGTWIPAPVCLSSGPPSPEEGERSPSHSTSPGLEPRGSHFLLQGNPLRYSKQHSPIHKPNQQQGQIPLGKKRWNTILLFDLSLSLSCLPIP